MNVFLEKHVTTTVQEIDTINGALLDLPHLKVSENKFYMNAHNIGQFYAEHGSNIVINPQEGIDQKSIDLILNGSVFGAILHQKKILPLHGSSFTLNGKGITICGNSGLGKSSVTIAFCQNGGRFISDDITPLKISSNSVSIISTSNYIKLWDDTLQKLHIEAEGLEKIRPSINKFYFLPQGQIPSEQNLDMLFILSKHNKDEFVVNKLTGMEKYNALRDQIYRKLYLKGMPETQKKYFQDLILLTNQIEVIAITRPQICNIYDTMRVIENEIRK
jgi:hypothetical protein